MTKTNLMALVMFLGANLLSQMSHSKVSGEFDRIARIAAIQKVGSSDFALSYISEKPLVRFTVQFLRDESGYYDCRDPEREDTCIYKSIVLQCFVLGQVGPDKNVKWENESCK